MSKRKNRFPDDPHPAAEAVIGPPRDSFDLVNKYGTYNVQDTSATPNDFPAIAQGLPKRKKTGPRR